VVTIRRQAAIFGSMRFIGARVGNDAFADV
jgi:hypothetical protein